MALIAKEGSSDPIPPSKREAKKRACAMKHMARDGKQSLRNKRENKQIGIPE
jgi:hypothetical protein